MSDQPVTTRTIAQACGYGQATVSMALRNDPRIKESTRQVILETAQKLGYQPDAQIARLMAGVKRRRIERQPQPLAYLIFWRSAQEHYAYATYRIYREGAQARAAEFGYVLEDFVVNNEGITTKRLGNILRTRAIPGMLIAPAQLPYHSPDFHGRDEDLDCADYAISAIGYSLASPVVNRATHDHTLGMELAFDQLLKRNISRIGLVCSHAMHVQVEGRWMAGYLLAQQHIPAGNRIPPLVLDDFKNAQAFDQWFDKHRPEALITAEVQELSLHLQRRGLSVPKDVSVIHLDASDSDPTYAGITQRRKEVGAAAFDLLLGQLHRHERGVPIQRKTVMLEGAWVEGNSIRP
jgi:LacI family transcriptional regulator